MVGAELRRGRHTLDVRQLGQSVLQATLKPIDLLAGKDQRATAENIIKHDQQETPRAKSLFLQFMHAPLHPQTASVTPLHCFLRLDHELPELPDR